MKYFIGFLVVSVIIIVEMYLILRRLWLPPKPCSARRARKCDKDIVHVLNCSRGCQGCPIKNHLIIKEVELPKEEVERFIARFEEPFQPRTQVSRYYYLHISNTVSNEGGLAIERKLGEDKTSFIQAKETKTSAI